MAAKGTCGTKLWRCAKCRKAVAAGPGNTKPPKCQSKGCGGTRIVAGRCERRAGWGTGHVGTGPCRQHGGTATQIEVAAERRRLVAQAAAELVRLGVTVEVTDDEALEALRAEAAGNVVVLRELVAGLGTHELYCDTYFENGSPTGRALPHVLVVMYNQERDRLADLSATCAKLGLDERRVRLDEAQVGRLLNAFTGAMADVKLPAETVSRLKQAMAARLRGG